MAVSSNYENSNSTVMIKISGRFDFSVHQEFRKAIDQTPPQVKVVVIDFYATEYMDSSALGMLLILRDKFNASSQSIKLINTKPEVKKILQIANFDKLFVLS